MDKPHVAALKRAITIAGSQSALAERIAKFMKRPTFSQQTVSKWLTKELLIEAEYWPAIEDATDHQVTRVHLRPELFKRNNGSRAAPQYA